MDITFSILAAHFFQRASKFVPSIFIKIWSSGIDKSFNGLFNACLISQHFLTEKMA